MNLFAKSLVLSLFAGIFSGCGTPSWEAGARSDDDFRDDSQAASLIEVQFGAGEAEVTKNIPEDAMHAVGKAVKSMRNQPVEEP